MINAMLDVVTDRLPITTPAIATVALTMAKERARAQTERLHRAEALVRALVAVAETQQAHLSGRTVEAIYESGAMPPDVVAAREWLGESA